MSNRNRTAGHDYERDTAAAYRDAGFPSAVTSRSESKRLDDAGIDLCFTGPVAVQCKRTANQPNYIKLLGRMNESLKKLNMPGQYPVVHHRRSREAATVTLLESDWLEIVGQLVAEGVWKA